MHNKTQPLFINKSIAQTNRKCPVTDVLITTCRLK